MTLAQIKYAERRMQQQWHALVIAEQEHQPPEALEQMYNLYIHFVEEFNTIQAAYARQSYRSKDPVRTIHTKSA